MELKTTISWRQRLIALLGAALITATAVLPSRAQTLPLLRDAEIEGLLKLYTDPIFRAAGLDPRAVRIYLVNRRDLNAFVAAGQRIFIHVGLLTTAKTPNQVIGVLAHETGHIAGGHLVRLRIQSSKISMINIIGTLAGVAAVAGAAAAGQSNVAGAGQGLMAGSQSLARRTLLAYARAQEASADQAAVTFLNRTRQSARGMLELFQLLANRSIGSINRVDPFVLSHPMPFQRLHTLEKLVKSSPYYERKDPPALVLRHKLMQAKLIGYLDNPQEVYRRYPLSDRSVPAMYARAISALRIGQTKSAVAIIDRLIRTIPQDPYFYEVKGEALLAGGLPKQAIAPLKKAARMLPGNGLVRLTLAQAYLAAGDSKANARAALKALTIAKRRENETSQVHMLAARAYAMLGNFAMAEYETAEVAYMRGDKELGVKKARSAMKRLKRGSQAWNRARDILNFMKRK